MNDKLVVGTKVRLLRAMLREPIGAVGYVVEIYDRKDEADRNGAFILFQNGSYDGFSEQEQKLFLEVICVDPRYTSYVFDNVWQLRKDFDKGYWSFE